MGRLQGKIREHTSPAYSGGRKEIKIYCIFKLELGNLTSIYIGLSYSGYSRCPFS